MSSHNTFEEQMVYGFFFLRENTFCGFLDIPSIKVIPSHGFIIHNQS
jgi:hypothetical protein